MYFPHEDAVDLGPLLPRNGEDKAGKGGHEPCAMLEVEVDVRMTMPAPESPLKGTATERERMGNRMRI